MNESCSRRTTRRPPSTRRRSELGAIINLDDITHIEYLERTRRAAGADLAFATTPARCAKGTPSSASPEEAKYGFTRDQLFDGYRRLQQKGVKRLRPAHDGCLQRAQRRVLRRDSAHAVRPGCGIGAEAGRPLRVRQPRRRHRHPLPPRAGGRSTCERWVPGVSTLYDESIRAGRLHPLESLSWKTAACITGPSATWSRTAMHHKAHLQELRGR